MTADGAPVAVSRRVLARPAEGVFEVVADLRRHARWIPLTRVTAPHPLRPGDVVVATSGPGAARGAPGLEDRMTVVRVTAPRTDPAGPGRVGVLALRKTGPVLLGPTEIRVRPLGERLCEVEWLEEVHLRGPDGRLGQPWRRTTAALLRPVLRAMTALALRRAAADLVPGRREVPA